MRIHLAIQYPLTGILSRVRKNASRHLQMSQGVPFVYLVHQVLAKLCAKWSSWRGSRLNVHTISMKHRLSQLPDLVQKSDRRPSMRGIMPFSSWLSG